MHILPFKLPAHYTLQCTNLWVYSMDRKAASSAETTRVRLLEPDQPLCQPEQCLPMPANALSFDGWWKQNCTPDQELKPQRKKAHSENILLIHGGFCTESHNNAINQITCTLFGQVMDQGTWHLWRDDAITIPQKTKKLTVILMLKVETCYICLNRQQLTEPASSGS